MWMTKKATIVKMINHANISPIPVHSVKADKMGQLAEKLKVHLS